VRFGPSVSKDTVTIGEPFIVRLRVSAPVGATIEFPDAPDSTGTVQALDPRVVVITDSVTTLDETATYRVAAWDVGAQPITLADVLVRWEGGEQRIATGNLRISVRSVLPADSALRVPKPARPIWEMAPFPWWIVVAVLAALALIGLWLWWRKRRRRPRIIPAVDPFERAQREFKRVESLGLLEAGERTRFMALMVEVMRDYLSARYAQASLALTSRELVTVLRRHPAVPVERLAHLLHEVDLVKFARWPLPPDRARDLARGTRAIVAHEHAASVPKPEQVAA
jgi:hypothetical protein